MKPFDENPTPLPWPPGPQRPTLHPRQVHLWVGDYRLNSDSLEGLLLSDSELQRADRFRKPADRARFIIRRGCVRRILGRYLDLGPETIELQNGPHGKPMLPPHRHSQSLEFNVSTSRDFFVCAVAYQAVGVDVEFMDPHLDAEALAGNVLSLNEMADFALCPRDRRINLFFAFWTAKEACVKCSGQGLGIDLKRVEIRDPGSVGRFEAFSDVTRWALIRMTPATGYTAAIASISEVSKVCGFSLAPVAQQ